MRLRMNSGRLQRGGNPEEGKKVCRVHRGEWNSDPQGLCHFDPEELERKCVREKEGGETNKKSFMKKKKPGKDKPRYSSEQAPCLKVKGGRKRAGKKE